MNPRRLYPFHDDGDPAHAVSLGRVPENPVYLYATASAPGWVDDTSAPSPRMLSDMAAVFDAPSVMSVIRKPRTARTPPSASIGEPYPPPVVPDPWLAT